MSKPLDDFVNRGGLGELIAAATELEHLVHSVRNMVTGATTRVENAVQDAVEAADAEAVATEEECRKRYSHGYAGAPFTAAGKVSRRSQNELFATFQCQCGGRIVLHEFGGNAVARGWTGVGCDFCARTYTVYHQHELKPHPSYQLQLEVPIPKSERKAEDSADDGEAS